MLPASVARALTASLTWSDAVARASLVPPGTLLAEIDRGYSPPWMEPEARRR